MAEAGLGRRLLRIGLLERPLAEMSPFEKARLVAEASGGLLGAGFAVSGAEKKVLQKLETAFAG